MYNTGLVQQEAELESHNVSGRPGTFACRQTIWILSKFHFESSQVIARSWPELLLLFVAHPSFDQLLVHERREWKTSSRLPFGAIRDCKAGSFTTRIRCSFSPGGTVQFPKQASQLRIASQVSCVFIRKATRSRSVGLARTNLFRRLNGYSSSITIGFLSPTRSCRSIRPCVIAAFHRARGNLLRLLAGVVRRGGFIGLLGYVDMETPMGECSSMQEHISPEHHIDALKSELPCIDPFRQWHLDKITGRQNFRHVPQICAGDP
jgi:hypothetical protein